MNKIIDVIRGLDLTKLDSVEVVLPYGKINDFIEILRSSNIVDLNRLSCKKYEYNLSIAYGVQIKVSPMDGHRFRGRSLANTKMIIYSSMDVSDDSRNEFLELIIPQIAYGNENWNDSIIHVKE